VDFTDGHAFITYCIRLLFINLKPMKSIELFQDAMSLTVVAFNNLLYIQIERICLGFRKIQHTFIGV